MKKVFTLCFFVLFSIIFCKAQYVTIPDTAFVNWLNNNGYAAAMNGNRLDTTSILVQNADTLTIGAPGMSNIISNLYGIQFFPSVQVLICDGNFSLNQIQAFPRNLNYLEVQNSPFLTSIPVIPSGVTSITINNNGLLSITNFPASARYIYCSGNQLTSLPVITGNSLIELDCSFNQLTSLQSLPSSLTFLLCGSNKLTTLPTLPNHLTELDCENNTGLTCFPYLPNSLEFIEYDQTGITCIPNIPVNTNSGNVYEPALTSLPLCSCTSGCGAYAGISITASQTTVCNGGKATFTATITNGGINPQYQWVVNGVNTGSSSPVFSDSTLTDGSTVSCVLTGNSTCADSTSAKSNPIVITVNSLLPSLIVNPISICSGSSGTLTASGATTYTWLPDTRLSATTGASITANPTVTTTYTVSGTNSCGTTMATAVVTVNSLPVVTVNSVELCATTPGTLTASGANTYTWSPAARLNSSTGASVIFIAITNGKTNITVTGTNSCGTATAIAVVTVISSVPTASLTPSSLTLCKGASATVTASGGDTYKWSPSAGLSATTGATVTVSPTASTSYLVTATNACGAGRARAIGVTVSASLAPTVTVNSPIICNGSGGTLTASGTSNTYSWLPSGGLSASTGSSVTASPTITSTYTVTGVVTSTGCSATNTSVVTVNPQPSVSVNALTLCTGNSGALTASGADTYSWLPSTGLSDTTGASVTANPTITTIYTVTGTNSCGTTTATSIVTINPLPAVSVNSLTICSGLSDTLKASGATTYAWLPSSGLSNTTGASVIANPTVTTTYTVSGTNSCGTTMAVAVVKLDTLHTLTVSPSIAICLINTTTLTVSGAATYTWAPATGLSVTTGSSITTQPSATTTYTVTGTNSCGATTATTVVTVNTGLPVSSISPASLVLCNGKSGTLIATSTGGGPYTYAWSPSTGLSATTGATVTTSPTITTGYSLIVSNACGSKAAKKATVTVNPIPAVTVNSPAICSGLSGTLTASGTSNTYSWSPSGGLGVSTGSSVTASPTITSTYTVTGVITSSGCSATNISVVTVNPQPIVSVNALTICNGNSGTLTATGATTYAWSPSAGLSATTGASVTANPTITTTYTVTGTNSCGITTATSIVTVNPLPAVSVNNLIICSGLSDTLSANGAYTFTWSPSSGLSTTTGASVIANPTITTTYTVSGTNSCGTTTAVAIVAVNPQPAVSVNNLTICSGLSDTLRANGADTYAWSPSSGLSNTTGASVIANSTTTTTYTVSGTNSCGTSTATSIVTVNPQPAVTVNNLTFCSGLSDTLKASGATTYTWSPSSGLSNTTGASVIANPLTTTTYTVSGTNGCGTTAATAIVTVNPQPATAVSNIAICNGTSGTLTASGADTYTWLPSTGLSATTGASIIANPTITTTYIVTGTNSCGATAAVAVVKVDAFSTLSISPPVTICLTSSAILTVSGATTYTWAPAKGLSATTGSMVTTRAGATTTYTVTGTNSCGATTATVVVSVSTAVPIATVSPTSLALCSGKSGKLIATATGGGPNTYSWSPSTGLSPSTGSTVTASPTVTTSYTLSVTNACGSGKKVATVTVNPLPAVTVNSPTTCNGSTVTLTTGGSGATAYNWSPTGTLSSSTGGSVTANPTITTTYSVTGISSSNCSTTATSVVTVNPLPAVTVNNLTICSGLSDTLKAGGADTYTWLPSTGLSNTTAAGVIANPTVTTTYTVSGTNSCGTSTAISVVTVNPQPATSVNSLTICSGLSDTLKASGADTYAWLPSTGLSNTTGGSVIANPTVTTTYTVSGTNSCGTSTATLVVTVNPLPNVSVNSLTICSGLGDTLKATGADTYTWSPSSGLSDTTGASVIANPGATGVYIVTGTNSCGASTATAAVFVLFPPAISVNNLTICSGLSDTLKANGAITYTWLPSNGLSNTTGASVIANPTITTTYTVSGTNSCGTTTATSVVTVNPLPVTAVNDLAICSGTSGTLTASGADTYTWSPSNGLNDTTGAGVAANPTVTTTYTVSGTNSCGTSITTTVVTVNTSLPVLTVTTPNATCGPSLQAITASGAITYAWEPPTALDTTAGARVMANPSVTTTYTVSGTNSCGTTTATAVVTVYSGKPVVSVVPSNPGLCIGSGTTVTASGAAATYKWSPSAGLSATIGATITIMVTTNTTYTVIGTDACGKGSGTIVPVTVNYPPVVSVNAVTICSGASGTLTANGADTYTWLPSTGLSATTGPSVSANPTVTTTYTVSGTTSCGTTTATAVVTVNPLPVVSVNNLTLCEGVGGTLTANGAGTYTWLPSKGLSATTGASVTANPTVTTTYTVSGTNSCGTTTNTAVVTVTPVYTSSFTVPSSPVCGADKAVAINYTGNAPAGATYNWDFDGGMGFVAGSDSQSISWDTAGTYTVSLTVVNGSCPSVLTTQNVVIKEMPSSAFTATSPVCDGHASIVTYTGNPVSNATYTWNFGGASGGVAGATNQALTFPGAGTYTISLIASADGCTSSLISQAIVINGLPSVYVNDLTICSGQSEAIAASGADTYTWLPSTGLTPTTGFSVTASPTVTTTYTITGTSICGTTSATAVITVNPQPYVSVNALTMCSGQSGTLTASGSATYTWAPAEGLNATTGASVTASPATTTTYSIVGTNSCNATLATTVVTVNKTPTAVATPGSAAGLEQFTANWNTAKGATGYMLDVSQQNNFSSFVTGYNNLSIGNVTSYTITGLTASTTYYYRVRANDDTACGIGPNSNTIAYFTSSCTAITGGAVTPASTIICPGATQLLTLDGLRGLSQQWQISTDNINWTNISSGGTATTYTTQSSDGNSKKYYRCLLFNGCFNAVSTTAIVDVSQPLITIKTTDITDNSLTLNWTPVGSGNYEVDYGGASSGTLTSITPPLTLTGLSPGSAYSVTITQTTPAVCSAFGIVSGVNTLCAPPASLQIAGTTNNSISLSWSGAAGNYRVYYMLLFTTQHVVKTKDVTNTTSAKIDSLLPGASYQFYVASLNCGSTPGQVSGFVTGTTTTTATITCKATAPVIDSVRTTCSSEVQIWVHGSTTGLYKIYLQPIAPVAQAVSSYSISGGNFSANEIAGQSFMVGAASVCSNGAIGTLAFWSQVLTVPATCGALNNLLIDQSACTGFTATWNMDNCATSTLSSYLLSVRKQGAISWASYSVLPTANFKVMSGLLPGTTYQCFVRSAYSCSSYLIYGPSSATQTVTTASNGCRVEDEQTVHEGESTPEALTGNSEESFSLYPNPNTGDFMIDFSRLNPNEEQVRIEVINLLGQTVLTHITSIANGHMNEFITLPNGAAAGTYIVRLTAGKNVYTAKMNVSK